MLKSKEISNILSQALKPISNEPESTRNSPLSLSLLSNDGLPLNTVANSDLIAKVDSDLSIDNLKIYSLLGLNYLSQQSKTAQEELNNWSILELDNNLNLIMQKLDYKENEVELDKLFAIIFYDKQFPNSIAKLKIDNLCKALSEGLRGYNRNGQFS